MTPIVHAPRPFCRRIPERIRVKAGAPPNEFVKRCKERRSAPNGAAGEARSARIRDRGAKGGDLGLPGRPLGRRIVLSSLASLLAAAVAAGEGDEIRVHRQRALAAYRAHDYATFLTESEKVAALAPLRPSALYNLACAHALLGRPGPALALLDRLARMGLAFDLEEDEDLASLRSTAEYRDITARMAALEAPLGASQVAFRIPERDLLPEGIAYDPRTRAFFVGSVHKRKVVRVDPAARATDFVPEGSDGLLSCLGLAIDPDRRALWVAAAAVPQTRGLEPREKGRSFVAEYDVDAARLRRIVEPPSAVPSARFADLSLGPDGALWVADPWSGRVYVLRAGAAAFEVFLEPGVVESPQGLAFSPDGRWLFVADYPRGVLRIDPRDGSSLLLEAPADASVAGIDGLVWARDSLVAIQNGIRPHRVVRLDLDGSWSRITRVDVLERAHDLFDEPTLGVVVGEDLYYVANSQYAAFDPDGRPREDRLRDPVILRLRVAPPRPPRP
jgi:sugar lactone lactonase YvrE